ncbi:cation transporting ATPase C-terminal domain-containing protein [Virgibacillus oceani]
MKSLIILFQLGLTHVPILQAAFSTASMELDYWEIQVLAGLIVFIVVEIEKYITRTSRFGKLLKKDSR